MLAAPKHKKPPAQVSASARGEAANNKFKCKPCELGFTNKKSYEKHRKTQEHKTKEKQKEANLEAERVKSLDEQKEAKRLKDAKMILSVDPNGHGVPLNITL